jgi:cell wall assembly regulator SMI1
MAFNFSSIQAFFTGAPSSSSSGARSKRGSAFGSGLPSASRRAPPGRLGDFDDGGAGTWSLPYSQRYGQESPSPFGNGSGMASPSSAGPLGQAYPPAPGSARPWRSENGAASSVTALTSGGGARPSMDANHSANISIPSTAYPPLRHTWQRIRKWCDDNYFELGDTLNWPALDSALDELEMTIGFSLPPAVRDSYLCYDGQELESKESCSDGIFFGLPLLSIEQITQEWRFWRNVDEDPSSGANDEVRGWMTSCPAGWVRSEYSCRGWLPLITDHVGNYIGVDLSPAPSGGGAPGQVILFGRDFDTKVVLWRGEGEGGWGRFLQFVAEELEAGEMWSLEEVNSGSEDEEDTVGYESYFSGGGSGAGLGGGDRGGSGAAGFRLTGDYKGWPVLEAWAERSMRNWEEIGLPAGQPAWTLETPALRLDESERVNENGEAIDAEGSGSQAQPEVAVLIEEDQSGASTSGEDAASHPLASPGSQGSSSTVTGAGASGSSAFVPAPIDARDTLSPPLPSTKASRAKQKQRELGPDAQLQQQQQQQVPRVRRPPPAPAAPLDLPTIDDVRAAHAAAMAASAGHYHFDMERNRPPAGAGGMGMGMGMRSSPVVPGGGLLPGGGNPRRSSNSGEWYRDAVRRGSANTGLGLRDTPMPRDDDSVELDTRSSSDAYDPLAANAAHASSNSMLSDVVVDSTAGSRQGGLTSPRLSSANSFTNTSRTPSRTLVANGELPLIDAGSAPSSPGLRQPSPYEPNVSSPLAGQGAFPGTPTLTRAPPPAVKSPPHSRTNSIMGSALVDATPKTQQQAAVTGALNFSSA